MTKKTMLSMVVASVLVLLITGPLAASPVRTFDWPSAIRDDRPPYDFTSERMFAGAVAGKGHVIDGVMYFTLNTVHGVMEVQVGPRQFVKASGFEPRVGEIVTVLGATVRMAGRQVLIAREVRSPTAIFIVRDRNGKPLWDADTPVRIDPETAADMCEMPQV